MSAPHVLRLAWATSLLGLGAYAVLAAMGLAGNPLRNVAIGAAFAVAAMVPLTVGLMRRAERRAWLTMASAVTAYAVSAIACCGCSTSLKSICPLAA